jgi:hypothetical protein
MDNDEDVINSSREFERILKKVSKDCKVCLGDGFIIETGRRATQCSVCVPKVKTYLSIKNSGISTEDIKKSSNVDKQLIDRRLICLSMSDSERRESIGFSLLKEDAKNGKKIFFIQLPQLIGEFKKGNKEFVRYDTIFIDNVDIYRMIDPYVITYFDSILFHFKITKGKRLVVGCSNMNDGYSARVQELLGGDLYVKF